MRGWWERVSSSSPPTPRYNQGMQAHTARMTLARCLALALAALLAACAPAPVTLRVVTPMPAGTLASAPATSTPTLAPTLPPNLLPADALDPGGVLCPAEPESAPFTLACADGAAIIRESASRRKLDSWLLRALPLDADEIAISFSVTSQPADPSRLDENAFGICLTDPNGGVRALRIQGGYFNFESWAMGDTIRVDQRLNPSFSPAIQPANQANAFRLVCTPAHCDLYANGEFIGRDPLGMPGGIASVGFFAASAWDECFGELRLGDLRAVAPSPQESTQPPFMLDDDLKIDRGTFSRTGLSGAFNDIEADGFHFSPVVSYGYYAARGGPSLADMSVQATVRMEITPGRKATRYAGIVCRSSAEGMRMAVIRADGAYTLYRDTPQRAFAILAKGTSDAIRTGLAENTLQLDCVGDEVAFYINDTFMASFTDARYNVSFGRAGLYTKAGGEPDPDAVVFSDFSVTEIR